MAMIVKEYGKQNAETIILLHGGGLSWWNYREEAALLQDHFHIVVPILDGHSGSDRSFTSIEANAQEICSYIDANCGGHVLAIGGLSLGAQITLEILSQRPDVCRVSLLESALAIPMKLTARMILSSIHMSYGLIQKQWFARLQFKELRIKPELFEDYYRDSCSIRKEDYIAFLKSNSTYEPKDSLRGAKAGALIVAGEKERKKILDSAKLLHKMIPNSEKKLLPGYYHGDLSINHPEQYVQVLLGLIASARDF